MKNLIIISGLSGAGKTVASNNLEDMGYLCIDQYPVELLDNLIELIRNDDSYKYQNVALSISLSNLQRFKNLFENTDLKPKLIILDCDKDELIKRYKFTRRVHPLLVSNKVNTLSEAVDYEKGILNKFRDEAHVIDTTNLTLKQHKETLDKILKFDDFNNLAISFVSFGFKYGVPTSADMVFDVRMLDNPFWEKKLKNKTGNDKAVVDYVLNNPKGQKFLKKLTSYIDYTLKTYDKEERRHLTICIGCTGGKHRSVSVTNYLYDYYKDKYLCYIKHRELRDK